MTFFQQLRGRGFPVLAIDGGDAFFGSPTKKPLTRKNEAYALSIAGRILEAYNYLGYRAMGVGPSDLQFGVDKLKGFLSKADFPIVCANLVEKKSGKPVFSGSVVLNIEGVKYGIYGVCLDSLNDSYEKRVLGEKYELLDALETTRKIVPELSRTCDLVIAISHLNITDNEKLLKEVSGIDILLDPYSRSGNKPVWVTEGEYVAWHGETPMIRIDGQGSRVGICEMYFPRTGDVKEDYAIYDYPLEPQIIDHPVMSEIARGKSAPANKTPHKTALFEELFLGAGTCGACHEEQQKFWENTTHSKAYASLTETGDHLNYECVECHTLGYGLSYVDPEKVGEFTEVQCERCHGLNSKHAEDPGRYRLDQVKESTCWGCHNPQIMKKPFDPKQTKAKVSCPKMEK